jgi:hypothetical protein
MNKLNVILLIIDIIITLAAVSYIMYRVNNEKLNHNKNKLIDSEGECLKVYKNKYDLLMKIIEITQSKYKIDSKVFEDAKQIDITSLDSFKNEKLLNKCFKEVLQIREDNTKVRETKAYKELISEYNKNEILLVSLRSYHNKYTLIFNDMIKKFPYNIISKIKRYNINSLIEGSEIDNNFNNNLEV